MPWLEGEEHRERLRYDSETPFTDPEGVLPLAQKQQSKLVGLVVVVVVVLVLVLVLVVLVAVVVIVPC